MVPPAVLRRNRAALRNPASRFEYESLGVFEQRRAVRVSASLRRSRAGIFRRGTLNVIATVSLIRWYFHDLTNSPFAAQKLEDIALLKSLGIDRRSKREWPEFVNVVGETEQESLLRCVVSERPGALAESLRLIRLKTVSAGTRCLFVGQHDIGCVAPKDHTTPR
jgi:hypothetical protein